MSDPRNQLRALHDRRDRYANYGDMLMKLTVRGVRCHQNTTIEVLSPITAFCGLNGTGKSTLLQVAAVAYSSPSEEVDPFYIRDFVVVGTLDPQPFADNAEIEFRYWQEDRELKKVTLSRIAGTRRWRGYARRPDRRVFFAGVGLYLPKIEQRDFIVREAARLTISHSEPVATRVKEWTSKVLGYGYESVMSHDVAHSSRSGKTVTVVRHGSRYSEAHMGYGEGRTQYIITALELLPERSLVLIEEPETSLHASAQYEFGRYLVDVALNKHHQVFLTTHSEALLESLPSEPRIFLNRHTSGIGTIVGLTASQARSLMANGFVKALHILVEDEVAKSVVREILRRTAPVLLRTVEIYPVGSCDIIEKTVQTLQRTNLPVAAVLDGDMRPKPKENIFSLPGHLPPEKEMLNSTSVRTHLSATYGVDLVDFLAVQKDVDHHNWLRLLADRANLNEIAIVCEVARAYVNGLQDAELSSLTEGLQEASRQ